MNDIILQIDSVQKSFARNIVNIRGQEENERFFIINDLDLPIQKGKITALIGGNGAGKTTLFNIISGLMQPDSGDIYFFDKKGISLIGQNPDKITRFGIGRMFQDSHIFPNMSVLDNMLIADSDNFGEFPFVSLFKSKKNEETEKYRIEKSRKVFEELFGKDNPFWDKKNDPANSLSYGQQRLLGLSRLFMGKYKLVLLDEPTAGVNPQTISQIIKIIRKLVKEKNVTVFLIEHNMEVVLDVADFCCFMSQGRIAVLGTPEDVVGNDEVRRTYLGM